MKKHADNLTLSQFGVANDKQETETQETVCRGRDYSGLDLKTHSHSFGFFFFLLTGNKFYIIDKYENELWRKQMFGFFCFFFIWKRPFGHITSKLSHRHN